MLRLRGDPARVFVHVARDDLGEVGLALQVPGLDRVAEARAEGRLEVLRLVGELAGAVAELLQLLEEAAELELLRKRGIDRRARFLSVLEW